MLLCCVSVRRQLEWTSSLLLLWRWKFAQSRELPTPSERGKGCFACYSCSVPWLPLCTIPSRQWR